MTPDSLLQILKEQQIKFLDLRFTDTLGAEQHVSLPSAAIDSHLLELGKMFDGSSIKGWQSIQNSDLTLMPDLEAAFVDPFRSISTLVIRCDVLDPENGAGYDLDPRSIAKRAETHLKQSGLGDACYVGPEPEFFIFDDVRWKVGINGAFYSVDSNEAIWNSDKEIQGGNKAHRPNIKGGYFPVPPIDSSQDLRAEMSDYLQRVGLEVEAHHHEVATGNQNEIATKYNSLLKKADEMQIYKYVIRNVAHKYNKSVTFMPKPLVGENGNGMHCHLSLWKDGQNLFSGSEYADLSTEALYFIGGIIQHAKALNAFTNPTTNSYKRLVPGFEAPVHLTYSARNRSAAIRIPHTQYPDAKRIEVRFPDPMANPYSAFSALMMAGLDGIRKQIKPGDASDVDLYCQSSETSDIPTVSSSLEVSLEALANDNEFLLEGAVFTKDYIDSYINLKFEEVRKYQECTHPIEFSMYYSG